MAPLVTASGVALGMACTAPWALLRVGSVNVHAERGEAIHAYLEAVVRFGRTQALSQVAEEYQAECAAVDVAEIEATASLSHAEMALVWTSATDDADEAGGAHHRDYSAIGEAEIPGTLDLLIEPENMRARVVDYKTGRAFVVGPADNWQIKTQALLASRWLDEKSVIGEIWKLTSDGGWIKLTHEFDEFDLDVIAAELRALLGRLAVARTQPPKPVEGEHCHYCPAFSQCPAKVSLGLAIMQPEAKELTVETAGKAWEWVQRAQEVVDHMRRRVEEMAAQGPLPLPDGRVLKMVQSSKEFVNGPVAKNVLAEYGEAGLAAVETVTTIKSSKAAITRALGKRSKEALEKIRAAGGLFNKVSERLEAVGEKP